MLITRRRLLEAISGSTFFLSVAPAALALQELPEGAPTIAFPHGVASGDPQPHAVMLWTRAQPEYGDHDRVPVQLQVSADEAFNDILLQAELATGADSDYTLRAHVDGLAPDRWYFYRFLGAGDAVSRTGRTRTAPSPDDDRPVNLAFGSCQSYENALYGSWARMIADDKAAPPDQQIRFVLHLGDFIYERSWPQLRDGSPQTRVLPPFPDGRQTDKNRYAVSLADYRFLYRTYLEDPHLQEARARWPFVCTWDDHEFSNDNFQSFSTYGGRHLLEAQRKLWSNQAWFEFIPTRLDELEDQPAHDFRPRELGPDTGKHNDTAVDSMCIYRRLRWGRHLDLVITDNRSYRSAPAISAALEEQLKLPLTPVKLVEITDAGREYGDGNPPQTLPWGDGVANPAQEREPGSMLGLTQRDWFLDTLESSAATWKIWGNSVPLVPMRLDLAALPFTAYENSVFSVDPWAGFPHEMHHLMSRLEERGITGVVSLSGDHHMHGAGTISRSASDPAAPPVAADFTVAGISSSPLFEDLAAVARQEYSGFRTLVYRETDAGVTPVWHLSMLDGVRSAYAYAKTGLYSLARWLGPNRANPGLAYVDTMANGYGLVRVDAKEIRVKMVTMQDCRADFTEPPAIRHAAVFRLPRWAPGGSPQLDGPEFEGPPPFPFAPSEV
jgi:alkaline phosphatase D